MGRARLAVVAFLVGTGCFQIRGVGDAGRQPIVDVQIFNIAELRQEAAAKVSDDDLKPTLRQMMTTWPDFAFRRARPNEAGWQLTVRLAQLTERTVDPSKPDLKARSAGVSLGLRALDDVEGENTEYVAELLLAREEASSAPITQLVQDALRKCGDRLMRFRKIQRGEPDVVVAAMSDKEESVRIVATQTAANRKIRAAIPQLIERLKDPDEAGAVIVSAVGALTALRATEATGAIIDTARRQERSYVVPLLYALAQLGGKEAEAYLFTVQSGHPDPVVKQAAAEALAELEAARAQP